MKPNRMFALVIGCLLLIPGLGMLASGGALGLAYAFGREDGYFTAALERVESSTPAITVEDLDLDLVIDPGSPDWLGDRLAVDVRLDVTGPASGAPLFVGIGPAAEVDAYLADVAHDEVIDSTRNTPTYRRHSGETEAGPPDEQDFWVESSSGNGAQRLVWPATSGTWTAVLMNADGSPGVAAEAAVGAKAGVVLPLAMSVLGLGVVTTALGALLIAFGAAGRRSRRPLTADTHRSASSKAAPDSEQKVPSRVDF